jgi:hypothetical protein
VSGWVTGMEGEKEITRERRKEILLGIPLVTSLDVWRVMCLASKKGSL